MDASGLAPTLAGCTSPFCFVLSSAPCQLLGTRLGWPAHKAESGRSHNESSSSSRSWVQSAVQRGVCGPGAAWQTGLQDTTQNKDRLAIPVVVFFFLKLFHSAQADLEWQPFCLSALVS